MRPTRRLLAHGMNKNGHLTPMFGSPGAPTIKLVEPTGVPNHMRSQDIVIEPRNGLRHQRLLHYLGKHVPFPQKSLWSPDSPIVQDRHLFKLTTIDIDAFKYWFGVKRCYVEKKAIPILWKAGLLPPSFEDNSPYVPRPVLDKAALYRYYLHHRKSIAAEEAENYANYENSMTKTEEQREAERPVAPFL